jgi:hypothetical protein
MYSMVMVVAMAGSPEVPTFGLKDKFGGGCQGCTGAVATSCGGGCNGGCSGMFGGKGCCLFGGKFGGFCGKSAGCHGGCMGGGGCHGGGCMGGAGCHGAVVAPAPMVVTPPPAPVAPPPPPVVQPAPVAVAPAPVCCETPAPSYGKGKCCFFGKKNRGYEYAAPVATAPCGTVEIPPPPGTVVPPPTTTPVDPKKEMPKTEVKPKVG